MWPISCGKKMRSYLCLEPVNARPDERAGLHVDERRRHLSSDWPSINLGDREIEFTANGRNIIWDRYHVLTHHAEASWRNVNITFPTATD